MERAMSNTSGGSGKKDDSATALRKRAIHPYGVEAHEITHATHPSDGIITFSRNIEDNMLRERVLKINMFYKGGQYLILQRTSYPLLKERP
jgi:hypothetical protein